MKFSSYITILLLIFNFSAYSQFIEINKEVKAKIEVEENADLIEVSGFAENSTDGYKSLYYKLHIFSEDSNSNKNKNLQSGRFTLDNDEKKLISKIQINTTNSTKLTILLQVFDEFQKVIASDRFSFQDKKNNDLGNITSKIKNKQSVDIDIPGLLYDETRTKFGKDFYDMLYAEFLNQKLKTPKNIVVEEELANRNSRIKIKVDYDIVNEFFISRPDYEFLQTSAIDTISKITAYFKRLEKQNKEITRF